MMGAPTSLRRFVDRVANMCHQLAPFMALDQKGKIMAEYIWIDAEGGVRSKSRASPSAAPPRDQLRRVEFVPADPCLDRNRLCLPSPVATSPPISQQYVFSLFPPDPSLFTLDCSRRDRPRPLTLAPLTVEL